MGYNVSTNAGFLRHNPGAANIKFGSLVAVFKTPNTLAAAWNVFELGLTTGPASLFAMATTASAQLTWQQGAFSYPSTSTLSTSTWYLAVVTKATGSVNPKLHFFKLDGANNSWVHETAAGTQADTGSTPSQVQFFRRGNVTTNTNNLIVIQMAAVYSRELSDNEIESLLGGRNSWLAQGPVALWDFSGVFNVVPDLSGGGATFGTQSGLQANNNAIPGWRGIGPKLKRRRGNLSSGTAIFKIRNDALGLTDTRVNAQVKYRVKTDTLGLTDATRPKPQAKVRVRSDALGMTDTRITTEGKNRVRTDAMGLTDGNVKTSGKFRTQTDTMGLTDTSRPHVSGLVRTITDALGLTDTFPRWRARYKTITDPMGLTDTRVNIQTKTRVRTDNLGLTDNRVQAQQKYRVQNNSMGLTDTRVIRKDIYKVKTDTMGLTDTHTHNTGIVRVVTDMLGITDSGLGGIIAIVYNPLGLRIHIANVANWFFGDRPRAVRGKGIDNNDDITDDPDVL